MNPLRLCALAAVLTLAACDAGSGPTPGGLDAANSSADAIQTTLTDRLGVVRRIPA